MCFIHQGGPQLRTRRVTFHGRVDRALATETVNSSSIPGRVKLKTIKIGITAFLLDVQQFVRQEGGFLT